MKKIFTLLTATFLSLSMFAYPLQTRLTISTNAKTNLTITVDGRAFNDRQLSDDQIVIENIAAGYHNIKVYQQRKNGGIFSKKAQLIYDGNINVKPQYDVDIVINRFGKAFVDESPLGRDQQASNGNGYPTGGNGYPSNGNGYPSNGYPTNGNNYPSNGNGGTYNQAMNGRAFDQFKYTLNNTSYESSKLNIARQTVEQNYLTAAQVKDILQLFSFENNKLDLAKFAYSRTLDKANYFTVNDAFSYTSSKDELSRYIRQGGR